MSRGRGRGSGLSLSLEQLQAMGIQRNDSSAPVLTPPSLFPKLDTKPLPLPSDSSTDYMLIVKDQFLEYLHESPAYVKMRTKNDDIERYSDKYKLLALDCKKNSTLDCIWANMPMELRPQAQRGRVNRKRKVDDANVIAQKLQTLEKKEINESTKKMETVEGGTVKKENESDDENLEDEQEQEFDMDDGTDYGNNYFDNGEEYEDEDDNIDDDAVY